MRVNQWRRFVAEQGMPLDALSYLSYPSEMVRKTGFDPVTPCSPSTCSAWLSYFLNKMARRVTRRRARCDREGMDGVYSNSRSSARNGVRRRTRTFTKRLVLSDLFRILHPRDKRAWLPDFITLQYINFSKRINLPLQIY